MDPRFQPHNTHSEEPAEFARLDPHLRRLARQPLVYRFPLLRQLPTREPGIYSVTGGRQVGKTTALKQWMADLLDRGTPPAQIVYFTGELIDDHHVLVRLLSDWLSSASTVAASGIRYLLLDEVTYIRDWDKGVKFLADAGLLDGTALVLTGPDSTLIRDARMRFPGRRGQAVAPDFHLSPLTFFETVVVKRVLPEDEVRDLWHGRSEVTRAAGQKLFGALAEYFVHGGYLTAINDIAAHGTIADATLATYADWVRGDVLKRGKHDHYLREVLGAVVKRYGTQVTWNSLARDLSIDHPATIADYLHLLARMDVLFIQPALREDRLAAAPKKARKVVFCDPFVLHAVRAWLKPGPDPFGRLVTPLVADSEWAGRLAEACAVSHHRLFHETYYIKGEGEVDIAYVEGGRFHPVEVKWTGQLRPKDLKQTLKYPNATICTRSAVPGRLHGLPAVPLPLALLRLGPAPVIMPR